MYCKNCGIELADGSTVCGRCGVQITEYQPQPQGYQPQQGYPPPPMPMYQPPQPQGYQPPPQGYQPPPQQGSFIGLLHSYGASNLFLAGICLYTAGSLINAIMLFNVTSIISLLILAVPIIGFWLIFAASKAPRLPEKIMPALTMFKVYAIIALVGIGLIALLGIIACAVLIFISFTESGSYFPGGSAILMVIGVVLLLVLIGLAVFNVVYIKALLNILSGLRNNIIYNAFAPLRGVRVFTVLYYISVGIAVLMSLSSLMVPVSMSEAIYTFPYEMQEIMLSFDYSSSQYALSFILTTAAYAGNIICIVLLNRLNRQLSYGASLYR